MSSEIDVICRGESIYRDKYGAGEDLIEKGLCYDTVVV